jgi:hypothetical protein
MKSEKASVFGETKGFGKTFEQSNFKSFRVARQYSAKSEVKYVS